jgi:hypothetical protein
MVAFSRSSPVPSTVRTPSANVTADMSRRSSSTSVTAVFRATARRSATAGEATAAVTDETAE